MCNYFPEVDVVKVTKNLVIHKEHAVKSFILAFKCFLNIFPEYLIVGYFSCVMFNRIIHIPKMCESFSKSIREQDAHQPVRALGLFFLVAAKLKSELSVSLSHFFLVL